METSEECPTAADDSTQAAAVQPSEKSEKELPSVLSKRVRTDVMEHRDFPPAPQNEQFDPKTVPTTRVAPKADKGGGTLGLSKKKLEIQRIMADRKPISHPIFKHYAVNGDESTLEKHARVLKSLHDQKSRLCGSASKDISGAPNDDKMRVKPKPLATLVKWNLKDYFEQTQYHIDSLDSMAKRISCQKPSLKCLKSFAKSLTQSKSNLSRILEAILEKIRESRHESVVRVGLSWLEALTYEIFCGLEMLFLLDQDFLKSLIEALAYVWTTCFERGSMVWIPSLRPDYLGSGGKTFTWENGVTSMLFLKMCEKSSPDVAEEREGAFKTYFLQAKDTLETLIWEINNDERECGSIRVNEVVKPIVDALEYIQKLTAHANKRRRTKVRRFFRFTERSLGLELREGGSYREKYIEVVNKSPGGAAESFKRLSVGAHLCMIGSMDVSRKPFDDVLDILRTCIRPVEIGFTSYEYK